MLFIQFFGVLLALAIQSSHAIYSEAKIKEALGDLMKVPMLQNSELNKLRIKDIFVLSNKEIPEAFMSNDGEAYVMPSVSFIEEDYEHLTKLQSAAETVVESFNELQAQAKPSLPAHVGLDQSCSDKLCYMLEFLLSCKSFNFGIKKICAQYLLGSFYQCSQFPSYPDSIYDAPSICLPEYATLFLSIAQGVLGVSTTFQTEISSYLLRNFTTNACDRRCYQSYQYYSNDFYLHCGAQVAQYSASYPVPAAIASFQPFRNQACGVNAKNKSCYVEVSTTFAEIKYVNKTTHGALHLPDIAHDYTCNYYGLNATSYNQSVASKNVGVLQKTCGILANFGCCAGSGISLVQLNQIQALKTKKPVVFPPCFLNYQRLSCPPVHLNQMCTKGSMADQATIQASVSLPKANNLFPNVYNQSSILTFQGIITTGLATFGYSKQPYNFNTKAPFQVYIIGYTYYNATGSQLTPANGVPAYPPTSDYQKAAKGTFYYQVIMQNVNSTQATQVQNLLASQNFRAFLGQAFQVGAANVAVGITTPAAVFVAEPDVLSSGAQGSMVLNSLFLLSTIFLITYQLIFAPLR